MELRRSPLGTYYTGALCGLGYNRITGKSLFPKHDLEIIFDVEITMNDLRMVRFLIFKIFTSHYTLHNTFR